MSQTVTPAVHTHTHTHTLPAGQEVMTEDTEQQIIRETFHLVSKRDENVCNFLEGGLLIGGSENKLIYRHYATLYFVFCVDSSESELGILDLIQVFVETLDKCFENVCELDLIFHMDKVTKPALKSRYTHDLFLTYCLRNPDSAHIPRLRPHPDTSHTLTTS
ncbi:unnamed protein product [Leuciscus chuanchicus]